MDSIDEIKKKLQQLERIKEVRRKAVNKYYNKWIKGDGDNLTDEERVLHEKRKEEHRLRAKEYYRANKQRISERDKAKYLQNKEKQKLLNEKSINAN